MKKLLPFLLLLILASCSNVKLGQLRNPAPDYNYSAINPTVPTKEEQVLDLNEKQTHQEMVKITKTETSSLQKSQEVNSTIISHAMKSNSLLSRIKLARKITKLMAHHEYQNDDAKAPFYGMEGLLVLAIIGAILLAALLIFFLIILLKAIFI